LCWGQTSSANRTIYNVRMEVVNSSLNVPAKQLANLESKAGNGVLSWTSDDFSAAALAPGAASPPPPPQVRPGGAGAPPQPPLHASATRREKEEWHQWHEHLQQQQRASGLQRRASDSVHPGVSFWPLPPELAGVDLCVEVRSQGHCDRSTMWQMMWGAACGDYELSGAGYTGYLNADLKG
jgi:hypothetical protein